MKYDKRLNYSRSKILILEYYFIHKWKYVQTIAFNLGINKNTLELIIREWEKNDENIIVESKINYD
jgi:hypothetical protein